MVKFARLRKGLLKLEMDIAAMSVNMNLARTQQDFGIAVLKEAMETDTEMAEETLQIVENLHPTLGHNIDVLA